MCCFMRTFKIAVLMATVIDAVPVMLTILSIKKPRRRPRGRKKTLTVSTLKLPDFDLGSKCRNPLPACPLHVVASHVSYSPGRRLPCSKAQPGAGGVPSSSNVQLSPPSPCAQNPGIRFPPWLKSAGLCVASWKHSRLKALLDWFSQSWNVLSFEQKLSWLEALVWEVKKRK